MFIGSFDKILVHEKVQPSDHNNLLHKEPQASKIAAIYRSEAIGSLLYLTVPSHLPRIIRKKYLNPSGYLTNCL